MTWFYPQQVCPTLSQSEGLTPMWQSYSNGLLVAFGLIMAIVPHTPAMHKVYSSIAAMLFALYIVYDTQLIVGGKGTHEYSVDDYAFAALNIYLDIVMLFSHLLELFGR